MLTDDSVSQMDIAYVIDKNVLIYALVSIYSVIINNKNKKIHFHILNNALSIDEKNKFLDFEKYANVYLTFYDIQDNEFRDFYLGHWSVTAYFKFKIGSTCKNIDKVLYLDTDTICLKNLDDIWNIDLSNEIIVARSENFNLPHVMSLNLKSNWYFNSGIMLINLKKWREKNIEKLLFKQALVEQDKYKYIDQDILNIVIDDQKKAIDEPKIYLKVWWTSDILKRERKKSPYLVHFIGPKPLEYTCKNIYKKEWWNYAKLLPIYKEIKNIHNKQRIKDIRDRLFFHWSTNEKELYSILGVKITIKKGCTNNA